jgi:hypothetical protein
MNKKLIAGLAGMVVLVGACSDYLTGGELSTDPNRPTVATSAQLFVGVQSATWALLGSDPPRVAGLWAQQFKGGNIQYVATYNYDVSEQTTNGFHQALYTTGGFVDIRKVESQARAAGDFITLGEAEVMEALVLGTGASMFGDLTYSHMLTGELAPPLDPQLSLYDSVQVVLDDAIRNLATEPSAANTGVGDADLTYGNDPEEWTKLAHTLKARFLMHTAEVRPTVYAQVLAQSNLGLSSPDDNYNAIFTGDAGQQNFWYQFDVVQRPGYLLPDPQFVTLLKSRNDPRLTTYFDTVRNRLAAPLRQPDATQPLVTVNENLLLGAEAAYRTGDEGTALTKLNQARALAGLPGESGVSGRALLNEILTEEYIALFQNIEAWNLYKRTCTPNLVPTNPSPSGLTGGKVPARFPYDAAERNTNSNIPQLGSQPRRNANDPANTISDGTGAACLGQ